MPPRPKWNTYGKAPSEMPLKLHEEWANRHEALVSKYKMNTSQSASTLSKTLPKPKAKATKTSDSLLRRNGASGLTRQVGGSNSTGTLKTIKSLKDKLSKINGVSQNMTDQQLKELVNLGQGIQEKSAREVSVHNSFANALNAVHGSQGSFNRAAAAMGSRI